MLELAKALDRFAANRKRLVSDSAADQTLILKHAAFTMLVPGGKASKAREAVDLLFQTGLPWEAAYDGQAIANIAKIIRPYVRFYRTKAKRLAGLWAMLPKLQFTLIRLEVDACRDYLVKNVPGYGPKAAAHFMRNVGLSAGDDALPIIDVHIRNFLFTLPFDSPYEVEEREFAHQAKQLGVNVHLLDACVWCAYSGNWKPDNADFDNFGVGHENETEH